MRKLAEYARGAEENKAIARQLLVHYMQQATGEPISADCQKEIGYIVDAIVSAAVATVAAQTVAAQRVQVSTSRIK